MTIVLRRVHVKTSALANNQVCYLFAQHATYPSEQAKPSKEPPLGTLGLSEHQDDILLARRAAEHPAAFDALYRRHVTRIYRYALSRTGNAQDAQDLTAQTFAAALHSIRQFRGDGSVAAWLTSIAHNLSASRYRAQQPVLALDEALPSPEPSPEELVGQALRLEAALDALARLPQDHAEVVRLRIFSELSTAETAALLGKSEAAVKMTLHRAIQSLRRLVGEQELRQR